MLTEESRLRLEQAVEQLHMDDHACLVYQTLGEKCAAAARFITIGLRQGERCLCFASEATISSILAELAATDLDAASAIAQGRLLLYNPGSTALEPALKLLEKTAREAGLEGTGQRFVGELPGAEGASEWQRLLEYESRLDALSQGHALSTLCMYDRLRISPEFVLDLVHIHNKVILGGSLSSSYSYGPERKTTQEAVSDGEEQFRTLCDSAPIGIFRTDSEGNNIYLNQQWLKIFGISLSEGMGRSWYQTIHPDDLEHVLETWRNATTTWSGYSYECRIVTAEGKTVWQRTLSNPIREPDGKFCGFVGTVEDITQRKQARLDLVKNQKLESLGILAGGIAHDFNNILTVILGNISLASLQVLEPEKVAKRLKEAENATVRAKDLTQQLLTFAQGGEPVKKVVGTGGLLKEAAGSAVQGADVRCEYDFAGGLWPLEVDEGQLNHVIHHLVHNAVEAMPNGGIVTVGAHNITSSRGQKYVKISVADTGIGISEYHLQRIFDPYFTTKEQGGGLGLATCHSIVKKHGGKIRATSTLGDGSVFEISLPASDRSEASGAETGICRGNGHVLVVDDEPDIRLILEMMLNELGYTAECLENGSRATELYQERKDQGRPFSAVILDLTIPGGIGGKEIIKELLAVDPQVKAIVSSGYSTDPVMANYREYGFSAVLCKPYRPQDMSSVLQELHKQ